MAWKTWIQALTLRIEALGRERRERNRRDQPSVGRYTIKGFAFILPFPLIDRRAFASTSWYMEYAMAVRVTRMARGRVDAG